MTLPRPYRAGQLPGLAAHRLTPKPVSGGLASRPVSCGLAPQGHDDQRHQLGREAQSDPM